MNQRTTQVPALPDGASFLNSNINYSNQTGVFAFGNHNQIFQILCTGRDEADQLAQAIRDGRSSTNVSHDQRAVPLPTLIVRVQAREAQWNLSLHWNLKDVESSSREVRSPVDADLKIWIADFFSLSTRALEKPDEHSRVNQLAQRIGDRLATVFDASELQRLKAAGFTDGPVAFVVIESSDDTVLSLPWELIRIDGEYVVRESRLDIARCVPNVTCQERYLPTVPARVYVNVCAPQGDNLPQLDYELESFRISQALHDQHAIVNEMGEVDDLIQVMTGASPPDIIHFSGHGSAGNLHFEDDIGNDAPIAINDLIRRIRTQGVQRMPGMFYLACCHGQTPGRTEDQIAGVSSTAASLHREGVPQIVAHYGPVYDHQATDAEAAFYDAIGLGRRTRDAVRAARAALARPFLAGARAAQRDAGAEFPNPAGQTPFAWALLVLYHRGADVPPGTAVSRQRNVQTVPQRQLEQPDANARTRPLKKGFIGRRKYLHAIRNRIRGVVPQPVTVVHGLGGIGKSVFCEKALALFQEEGFQPVRVECGAAEREEFSDADSPRTVDQPGAKYTSTGAWLVGQILDAITQFIASGSEAGVRPDVWEHLKRQVEGSEPVDQLSALLSTFERRAELARIVISLDNLESLMRLPAADDGREYASMPWNGASAKAVWNCLTTAANRSPQRLRVLASSRYVPEEDRNAWSMHLPALTSDEIFRMVGWFPALKHLSRSSRARLVSIVAGHGRAVEFLDGLVEEQLNNYLRYHTSLPPVATQQQAQAEWDLLVAPCIVDMNDDLTEDLLFKKLWHQVLTPAQRTLLIRMTAVLFPTEVAMLQSLFDHDVRQVDFDRLRRLSLVEESTAGQTVGARQFHTHPLTDRLVRPLAEQGWEHERQIAFHSLAKAHEQRFASSRDAQDSYAAGQYFFHAQDLHKASEYMGGLAEQQANLGYVGRAFRILRPLMIVEQLDRLPEIHAINIRGVIAKIWLTSGDLITAERLISRAIEAGVEILKSAPESTEVARSVSVSHDQLGQVCLAQGNLSGAETAFREGLKISERLASQDPNNAQWQRDLSVSHNQLGQVCLAQGNLSGAETAFREGLKIRERLASQDPNNAQWQRDLSVSHKKMAQIAMQKSDLQTTISNLVAALAIDAALAELDPVNVQFQEDYVRSLVLVGQLLMHTSAEGKAMGRTMLVKALAVAERLEQAGMATTVEARQLPVMIRTMIEQADGGVHREQ